MDKQNKQSKKTGIGLAILGLVILTILTVGGIVFSKVVTTKQYEGDIASFSFHSGSYWGYAEYDIENSDGRVTFRATGFNGNDMNVEKTISGEYLDRISDIIKKYDVASWDGFDESDDGILDGHGFTLKIKYTSGATLEAHGYMKYPRNYDEVDEELSEIFDELTD